MSVFNDQLENCHRLRIEVPPTAFPSETLTLTLTLTSDLDFQSHESYGHDHIQAKGQGQRLLGLTVRVETDGGQMDAGDCITTHAVSIY